MNGSPSPNPLWQSLGPSVDVAKSSKGDEFDSQYDEQLAVLLTSLADRIQKGEPVDLESECKAHPAIAGELRSLWGTLMVTQAIGVNSSSASEEPWPTSRSDWSPTDFPRPFGEYELLEELGRGGMGLVYLASQPRLGRQVALKMILRDSLATPQDRVRFRSEAEALAKLEHPGIVPIYEVGEVDGTPFFSMQYIRGTTLSAMLQNGPISQREAARWIAQMARALHFAHERGVLHRDIKPSNILVDELGNARLTDFGLAKQIDANESLTGTGAVLGTPAYMSPEQASGRSSQLAATSDVFSLGTVLYHCLTGEQPFTASSPLQLAMKIVEQDPPPPRMIDARIDRDLEMIVVRAMQKPTDLRYATAMDMANDLEAFLRDEPVAVRSGRIAQVVARALRETHHASVLENWGLLWMWHSLALIIACFATWWLQHAGTDSRIPYATLWIVGLGAWAGVFWVLRRRMGPVTFVERQIAHVWGASMIAIALVFPLEWWLDLKPLTLSPMLGIITGMVFLIKAGILSGAFYLQAGVLFVTAMLMAVFPSVAHLIFGIVSAGCFFFPGLKYYRQKLRQAT